MDRLNIAGYDFEHVKRSPVGLEERRRIEATVEFAEADRRALSEAAKILAPQAEEIVDEWRAIIRDQPHLAKWFFGADGKPDERYKAAVKARFVQWVIDLCT